MEVGRGLAQAELDVAQLVAGALQLGREPFERRDRALRERDETGGALAVVGSERLAAASAAPEASSATCRCRSRSARSCSSSPGSMPSVSSTSARSSASRASASAAFAVSSSCRRRAAWSSRHAARAAARRASCSSPQNAVEHLELVGRPREPALLELARHRDHALDGGRDVLPRSRASPRVGARAAVGEDRGARRRARPRPPAAAPRALRAPPGGRAPPRRTPPRRRPRRTRRRPSRRAGGRTPGRGSSCRPRSPR